MTIETNRLILRPFEKTDAADLFEYLKKPTVNCFACMKIDSVKQAEEQVRERMKDELYLAITLKETGKVIGEIFSHPESADPEKDAPLDTYSPCWMLNEAYYGKGYGYEAAKAYLDYLFEDKGARRIYAYTEDYNVASRRVCEKLGMRKEGLFLDFVSFIDDEDGNPIYENTYQYAILKREWEQREK